MRVAHLSDIGLAAGETSARSMARVRVLTSQGPAVNMPVNAYSRNVIISVGSTDDNGYADLEIMDSAGVTVGMKPKTPFFKKAIPESVGVTTKAVGKSWSEDEVPVLRIVYKDIEDFLTLTNLVIGGVIGLGLYYMLRKDE